MKRRIVFATSNEGKIREIKMILKDLDCEVVSLKEAGIDADIVEDGETFEDNAIIKAETIMKLTNDIVVADDSGLEVDYLDKAPGVYSARFLGEDTPYSVKNKYIIDKLEGVEVEKRTARFVCTIACAFPDKETVVKRATIEGYIGYEEKGTNGFGYDPIFMYPQYNCTTAELSSDKKNEISHRGKALRLMKPVIEEYIKNN
ncbi:MAG: XTP/dITP diphosphatase [Lachnospiraceae bacterium]|nr:XTP/dITP diphosphatase [Lachnospiraceae bacterium]